MPRPSALTLSTVLALLVIQASISLGQTASATKRKVKLVDWKAQPCDNTYDPYQLVDRIIEIRVENGITYLTINFSENCCADFQPQIAFKNNRLDVLPYKGDLYRQCGCQCCFTIEFAIKGLPASGYETYFHGKKVELSNDYYKVYPLTSEVYNGQTINRTNRYGFKEGLWITFDSVGNIKTTEQYPESELRYESYYPIWKKDFYPSGRLSSFDRKDTTQLWFEDGTLKAEFLEYKVGDTIFKKEYRLHDNRKPYKKSLRKDYYENKESRVEILYKEEYYENGQPKFLFGKDTTYTLHPNGRIASRAFGKQRIDYDQDGFVSERVFRWSTKDSAYRYDLDNALYAEIGRNGKVFKIKYSRHEIHQGGMSTAHYEWTWDEAGTLIESPERWKEPFPWKKFSELLIP